MPATWSYSSAHALIHRLHHSAPLEFGCPESCVTDGHSTSRSRCMCCHWGECSMGQLLCVQWQLTSCLLILLDSSGNFASMDYYCVIREGHVYSLKAKPVHSLKGWATQRLFFSPPWSHRQHNAHASSKSLLMLFSEQITLAPVMRT